MLQMKSNLACLQCKIALLAKYIWIWLQSVCKLVRMFTSLQTACSVLSPATGKWYHVTSFSPLLWFYPITFLSTATHKLVHLARTSLNKQNLSHSAVFTADRQPLQTHYSISFAGSCSHNKRCSRIQNARNTHTDTQTNRYISVERLNKKKVVLTTKLLLTFSKMRFSFSAIASPFLFFTRFFSSFLQAYILPVARTWQAQTWKTSTEETLSHTHAHKIN